MAKRVKWKSELRGSGEYERRGSAEEYWDSDTSTGALQGEWGALEEGKCVYSAV